MEHPLVHTVGYTSLALGYGCLLVSFLTIDPGSAVAGPALRSWLARGLAWVGVWSYSIYLWHMELFNLANFASRYLADKLGPDDRFAQGLGKDAIELIYLAASIALGVLLGRLLERPALAWRERHYPSRSGSAIAAVVSPAIASSAGLRDGRGAAVETGPLPISAAN